MRQVGRLGAWVVGVGLIVGCSADERPADGTPRSVATDRARPEAAPSPEELRQLEALADAAYRASDFDSAIVLFGRLESSARRAQDVRTTARALMWSGHAHRWLGDLESARAKGEEALAVRIEEGFRDELAASRNALGLVAWDDGRLLEAQEHFESSIRLAEEFGNRRAAAAASGNLGLVYTAMGDLTEARRRFEEQRRVMIELQGTEADPDTLAWLARAEGNALTNLSMVEVRRGNLRPAIAHAEAAIEVYGETDYSAGFQNAIAQLGTAYTGIGESHLAFAALESALARSRALGLERETASNIEMLAELYREAGDHQRTLRLYAEAREINSRLGLELETAGDLRGEAQILVELGELGAAADLTHEARTIHRAVGARLEELRDVLMLARIGDLRDDEEAVRERLAEAQDMAGRLGGPTARAEVIFAEAQSAARRQRPTAVLSALRSVEDELDRGAYNVEWQAHLLRSQAHADLGRLDSAAVWGRRALSVVERVRGSLGSGELRSSFTAQRTAVYSHLASVLLRLGRPDEALEVADAARGRALLEYYSGERARPDRLTSGVAESRVLLREIESTADEIAFLEEIPLDERWESDADRIELLRTRLEQKRRAYESLLVRLQSSEPGAMTLLGGLAVGAEPIRDALGPGEVLVEYLLTDDRVLMFLVSPSRVTSAESEIGREDLESRVRLARDLIATSPRALADKTSQQLLDPVLEGLHDVLIRALGETGELVDVDHLIVVPHEVLTYLPFGALRDASTGRYLVEDYEISLLASAASLPALRARDRGRDAVPLVASAFAPFPDELPETEAEVAAIQAVEVRPFVGSGATESRVREALASGGVVHLATHGVMNAQNPLFSRMELARPIGSGPDDDGRLEVHEVLELDVEATLVFLSGCETGVGAAHSTAFVRGQDYATLAQAFLFAGAQSVVATLWPVEDDGARALAERFYARSDEGAAESLARAQRAMIADERFGAPYYWAAFQVAGAPT